MNVVRLFMRDGRITKFCAGLSYTTRKRVFRAIRIVRKKQFKRMLKEWVFNEDIQAKPYGGERAIYRRDR